MHRIVHLDLKGAPYKIPYLEQVILVMKLWGATGVIIEWEDTFPYSGYISEIGSVNNSGGDNMYTLEEVQHILQFIRDQGLEPIQLIQTIGHMEFVLKHPTFRELREVDRSPAVLCPSKPKSELLVKTMLEQALDAQPDALYIHIGADEVWHTAVCSDCQEKSTYCKNKGASLYLDHIRNLVLFLKEKRPELTVLMWDDMLRAISIEILTEYGVGDLIVPVVWHYSASENFNIHSKIWDIYAKLFPKVWAASAFKGANGSCQILSPVQRYVSNHDGWVSVIKEHAENIKFDGIILTGWSRYDHYATLCELLPVSLPSLAACLRVLTRAEGLPRENFIQEILPSPEWPGEDLARRIHCFVIMRDRIQTFLNSDLIKTWLNPWQLQRKYTVPMHVEGIAVAAQHLMEELKLLQIDITGYLLKITGKRSTEEWLKTFLVPLMKQLAVMCQISYDRSQCDASVKPLM